jgi:hypothetical protein
VERSLAQQFKVQQCESAGFQDHQTTAETFCNHTQSFGRDVRTEKYVLVLQKIIHQYQLKYGTTGIISREKVYHPNPYI